MYYVCSHSRGGKKAIQGSIYALNIYFFNPELFASRLSADLVMETGGMHSCLVAFLNNEQNIENSGVSSGDISDKLDFCM